MSRPGAASTASGGAREHKVPFPSKFRHFSLPPCGNKVDYHSLHWRRPSPREATAVQTLPFPPQFRHFPLPPCVSAVVSRHGPCRATVADDSVAGPLEYLPATEFTPVLPPSQSRWFPGALQGPRGSSREGVRHPSGLGSRPPSPLPSHGVADVPPRRCFERRRARQRGRTAVSAQISPLSRSRLPMHGGRPCTALADTGGGWHPSEEQSADSSPFSPLSPSRLGDDGGGSGRPAVS